MAGSKKTKGVIGDTFTPDLGAWALSSFQNTFTPDLSDITGQVAPSFESMFEPNGDDLLEYPDGLSAEEMVDYELSETLRRIKEEKAARREEYRLTVDPNFYLVVCFQSTAQRDEFIEKAGWEDLGFPFVDGLRVAKLLGVDVQPISLPRKNVRLAPVSLRDTDFID